MTERDGTRLIAWARELRDVHARLRGALATVQETAAAGRDVDHGRPGRDLLLFCHGFCAALTGHHEGEDRVLFPAVEADHPELADTLRALSQDHSMIAHLLGGLQDAVDRAATADELERHVEGVAAVMESHFRYEERALLEVLGTLRLDAEAHDVLGPL